MRSTLLVCVSGVIKIMSNLQKQIQLAKYYRSLKFLVVDDFENFRLSIRQMIRAFGVERIEVAGNGEDAVARCEHEHFDIILCDYNLGSGKSGQQVLEELRHNDILKHTSIFILITAETSKDMVMGALEYLPDGYITKPITKAVLQKRLDGLIEQREILKPINEAIDQGKIDLAIELVNREIKLETKYVTWCFRTLASLYYRKKQYEPARKIYEDVLSKRDIGWARLGLSKVQIATGQYDEAIRGLRGLLKQNPNIIEAYDSLADAQLLAGKSKEAQETLKEAVAISPHAILRQQKLAEVCEKNKDVEGAADAYRASVKLGHNSVHESADNYLNLGKNLSDLAEGDSTDEGKKKAKEALHVLGRAAKKFRDNSEVVANSHLIEARVHKGQGDDEKGEMALERAKGTMDLNSASAETSLEFAKTLYSMGQEESAEEVLRNLASQNADNKEVLASIEELLDEPVSLQHRIKARSLNKQGIEAFEQGDLEEAILVFQEALEVTPKHPALNLNSVQVMLKQIKQQGGNPLLVQKCKNCLANAAHIPPQHRQYKRLKSLEQKVAKLAG